MTVRSLETQDTNLVVRYLHEHPTDYRGADRVARTHYAQPLRIHLNGIAGALSGEQAQQVLDARHAQRKDLLARKRAGETIMAIPTDAFTVGFVWAPTTGGVGFATGTWDFRDDYVGAEAPDNIGTVGVELGNCLQLGDTRSSARNYQGTPAPADTTYLRDAGLTSGSPIVGVRDTVSGFVQAADNGTITTDVTVKPGCGPTPTQGQFIYAHNQGGGSVLSASAGFGFLNISYSSPQMELQKSSDIAGFTIPA
ncbi:hypothetical protein ACOBQX_14900 [Actinokineospora sp. G85]|uniref:hypothetical protein n=1 Tax=Actinokineospora sp. G85 TaxID=3406626 RepID=UPI003C7700B5